MASAPQLVQFWAKVPSDLGQTRIDNVADSSESVLCRLWRHADKSPFDSRSRFVALIWF